MTFNFIYRYILVLFLLLNLSCGGDAGTRVGNPPSITTQAFPSNLIIASPLASSSLNTTQNMTKRSTLEYGLPGIYSGYTEDIEAILEGNTYEDCYALNLDNLESQTFNNASCYGPEVIYGNHPNGDHSSGTLPIGDVGLWTETESGTDEACAAAQINARMATYTNKNQEILKLMASMVCVMNVNDLDMPENDSLDLTSYMQEMLIQNDDDTIQINTASIQTQIDDETQNTIYAYLIEMTLTEKEYHINLWHMPLDNDNTTYRGIYNYMWDNDPIGNCVNNTLEAGSVIYNQLTSQELKLRTDSSFYCSPQAEPFDEYGLADPENSFDPVNNPEGWGNNWSTFQADFNLETREGIYSYAWQAGQSDSNTRVFNIALSLNDDNFIQGEAFFGFGPPVITNDIGNINGFICNWAGPGNNHGLKPHVQHQSVLENASGIFEPTSSSLTYSPQNECDYLETDDYFGLFSFDSDGDGNMDTDPNEEVSNELFNVTDSNADGFLDEIVDEGLVFPLEIPNI